MIVSRLERYRVVAGYGGWDDGTPSSTDSDRVIARFLALIGVELSGKRDRKHTRRCFAGPGRSSRCWDWLHGVGVVGPDEAGLTGGGGLE